MSDILGPPTIAGYTDFLREAGISTTVLPDNSFAITLSFNVAVGIVTTQLNTIDPDIYTLAVYNLATDRLLNYANDQAGQNFFEELRAKYRLNAFLAGVVESSADEGTSQSLAVPESLRQLQLMDLSNLNTPYGRTYISFAQMIGTLWGLT